MCVSLPCECELDRRLLCVRLWRLFELTTYDRRRPRSPTVFGDPRWIGLPPVASSETATLRESCESLRFATSAEATNISRTVSEECNIQRWP